MDERKNFSSHGFTLIELLVVVIIIGVLASIAVPRYAKSIEQAKADDAAAFVRMIGNTNRMFRLDNDFYTVGTIAGTCACNPPANTACQLIGCRYLASQDWASKSYTFYSIDGDSPSAPCGAGAPAAPVACAKRCVGAPPCSNSTVYKTWGYYMDENGALTAVGTDVPPPPSGI